MTVKMLKVEEITVEQEINLSGLFCRTFPSGVSSV